MSGRRRFLLDTNAVVALLAGNRELAAQLEAAEYIGMSVISYLEFLAFDDLTDSDRACFASFCERVEIVALAHEDSGLVELALDLRIRHRLKLPDAIIGATALSRDALLITNDSHFAAVAMLAVQGC
ncbi:MAG: twitching motility protein PilT [Deltaproteobacteria bacterium CG_4_10_14_3_um_filter_60_8]|nr:MAG: twitching motility protein PilT [Deltaproteobacteria bacterium CG_4_10_14_3_um_filter_60_8]